MNAYLNGNAADWYAEFVVSESDAIAAAYRLAPDAAVTTCGDWTVTRLVQHLGSVHRWATHIVEHGAAPADPASLKAPADVDLGQWLVDGAGTAANILRSVDPSSAAWNPWPVPQIAGVWPRRMAQETAMHRYDADLAIGLERPIEATLASDGIDEYLLWAVPRAAVDGVPIPSGSLHIHSTDVDGEWLVTNDANGYRVDREHAKGDAALRGSANDLLLALWSRPFADGAIEIIGDGEVAARWLSVGGR